MTCGGDITGAIQIQRGKRETMKREGDEKKREKREEREEGEQEQMRERKEREGYFENFKQ